ncbi:unnamed protein product [Prunus armeniaca]
MHYYRVDFVYEMIALQLQELNSRFNEANTELLLCLACLSPNDSFSSFDKQKLIRLTQLYPNDFSTQELEVLKDQLQTYIDDMHSNTNFSELQGIAALAKKLVETKKDRAYPLVYLLIKLALTLPVATASVERAFSAMNIVNNRMRNQMGDQWMNDCLNMKSRRGQFPQINESLGPPLVSSTPYVLRKVRVELDAHLLVQQHLDLVDELK